MTTDATRANARAMPELNRRRLLIGLAASTAAAPTVAIANTDAISGAADEIEENPDLIAAWHQHREAEAEYWTAKDELGWLADEWKHLWPLAPEGILGVLTPPNTPTT